MDWKGSAGDDLFVFSLNPLMVVMMEMELVMEMVMVMEVMEVMVDHHW